LAVLNGLLAPIPEDRKRRLAAFARECIINSGGDPAATPNNCIRQPDFANTGVTSGGGGSDEP